MGDSVRDGEWPEVREGGRAPRDLRPFGRMGLELFDGVAAGAGRRPECYPFRDLLDLEAALDDSLITTGLSHHDLELKLVA
jgi:hypothetical protein